MRLMTGVLTSRKEEAANEEEAKAAHLQQESGVAAEDPETAQ